MPRSPSIVPEHVDRDTHLGRQGDGAGTFGTKSLLRDQVLCSLGMPPSLDPWE
jgi:hypothetical protein